MSRNPGNYKTTCASADLEPREELIGILMLAHINRLAIVVFERLPEVDRLVEVRVAQRQVCKHPLRRPQVHLRQRANVCSEIIAFRKATNQL